MLNTNNPKTLTALISGAYCLLVLSLAIVFLSGASSESKVEASNHDRSQSVAWTGNVVPLQAGVLKFDAIGDGLTQTASSSNLKAYDIDLENVPFDLRWETENATDVEATSNPTHENWNGSKTEASGVHTQIIRKSVPPPENPSSLDDYINLYYERALSRTYTYDIEAFNNAADPGDRNSEAATVRVSVSDSPRFTVGVATTTPIEIDGEPGSTSSIPIQIDAHKFDGDVTMLVGRDNDSEIDCDGVGQDDLPAALCRDTNAMMAFSFSTQPVSFSYDPSTGYPSPSTNGVDLIKTTMLEIEVIQPIYDDLSRVNLPVKANNASDTHDLDIPLDVDGFNPRTIEEF